MTENAIGTLVVSAAIAVHRELGPGLLETVYLNFGEAVMKTGISRGVNGLEEWVVRQFEQLHLLATASHSPPPFLSIA